MCNLIIFGASGDIAKKKIFPALYEWFNDDQSSLNKIIGYGRTQFSQIEFHQKINITNNNFLEYFDYQIGHYDSTTDFIKLKNKLETSSISKGDTIILYCGIPSEVILEIVNNSILSGIDGDYDCRYILEKPIGNNLVQCKQILKGIKNTIEFDKIYIIDHYLGKSNIRNLISSRNKNMLKKDNQNQIYKIEIILYEKETVDHRLKYFDKVGLFKDMVQSHVMTILLYCFPNLFSKNKLSNIRIIDSLRGQYIGYKGSNNTETYIKLVIDWNDIEVSIEVGKGMAVNRKEIKYSSNSGISIVPITSNYSEYKSLFQDTLMGNKNNYLTIQDIQYFWKLSDNILEKMDTNSIFYYDIPLIK